MFYEYRKMMNTCFHKRYFRACWTAAPINADARSFKSTVAYPFLEVNLQVILKQKAFIHTLWKLGQTFDMGYKKWSKFQMCTFSKLAVRENTRITFPSIHSQVFLFKRNSEYVLVH